MGDAVAPVTLPGNLVYQDHVFRVPLDHGKDAGGPPGQHIEVFVREVVLQKNRGRKDLPTLLFLQGGPGFEAARPTAGGWLGRALQDHRVLLLDGRGTGRSTPVTSQTLRGMTVDEQAEYLLCFRADSIVRDCESVRRALGIDKIKLLGQSFGGFCALTYLSLFPESLAEVYITGGLGPVLVSHPDDVYRSLKSRVLARNRRYYARYPGDVAKVREIVSHLEAAPGGGVALPSGGRLTARRFLTLGINLGSGSGSETLHWLVESAFVSCAGGPELDYRFLTQVEALQSSFDTNPIYWVLHESIYCGPGTGASQWSAQRVLDGDDKFDHVATLRDADAPVMFTGEMVFPWFAEDWATLHELRGVAEVLAARSDWSPLYDVERLRDTKVPVAAAVYYDDMYVERAFSEDVAALLGDNCKIWVTNQFQHTGIRDNGALIMDALMGMLKGDVQIPS